jgi:hypothetical protein
VTISLEIIIFLLDIITGIGPPRPHLVPAPLLTFACSRSHSRFFCFAHSCLCLRQGRRFATALPSCGFVSKKLGATLGEFHVDQDGDDCEPVEYISLNGTNCQKKYPTVRSRETSTTRPTGSIVRPPGHGVEYRPLLPVVGRFGACCCRQQQSKMPDVPAHVVGAGSFITNVVSVRDEEVGERVLLECADGTCKEA